MASQPYNTHWQFALTTALARLEYLVWRFDFVTDVGEQGYIGVPTPNALSNIIVGFLGESAWLFEGDQTRLIKMQTYVVDQLVPSYEVGQSKAQEVWKQTTPSERQQLLNATVVDIRQMGSEHGPSNASPTEQSWFMEGFCRQWWQIEYIHYLQQLS